MITKKVEVLVSIDVTIDETKVTPEFIAEFESFMFPCGSLDSHIKNLGRLAAIGYISDERFIEGYGPPKDMGIKFGDPNVIEVDVIEPVAS